MNNNIIDPYLMLYFMKLNELFNGNQQFNSLNQPNQFPSFFIPQNYPNYCCYPLPNQNPIQHINIGKTFYQVNYNVNKTENDFNTINHHFQNTVNQNNKFNQSPNPFFNDNIQLNHKSNTNFKIIKDENLQLNLNEKSENLIEKNNENNEIELDKNEEKEKIQFLEKKRKENEIIENNIEKKKSDNDIIDGDFEINEVKQKRNKKKKRKKIISKKSINNNNKSDNNNKINNKINNSNKNNSNNNIINNNNDNVKKSNSKNILNPIINMNLRSKNNNINNKTNIQNHEIINIQSPEAESILLNDFQNHLNDKFFDLVNNKKHTKKYRELNYISSTNPKDFMEENFYKKMKEKFIPRTKENVKLCDNIPKFHSSSINDIKPVISSYNYKTFKELNKDLKIKEVLNQIEKIWPKNLIKCYDDRILNFIAICNYNIDLAIEHIKNKTREFISYIDELNRQNLNIENTIINQDNINKKEKNRK